ncbi:hypothetical protein CEXT_33351 [Caerostris extrusa]|uniref:Uncharacterized protein n=1 Tax=Caerostris extrusa TaxID=172846 RepID=A0AAV4T7K0_CAEEX|nr:hypothetical protein CEXT_33351 [Caerostris extrusa]
MDVTRTTIQSKTKEKHQRQMTNVPISDQCQSKAKEKHQRQMTNVPISDQWYVVVTFRVTCHDPGAPVT